MDARTTALSEKLQLHLDDLTSPRTSSARKLEALKEVERQLAISCTSEGDFEFMALQYTFECNVPSRLLHTISTSTLRLESLLTKAENEAESQTLSNQLTLSLSLMQGLVLNHSNSKVFVSRKWALEVLLDLLLAARRLPSSETTLSSAIIDTLLCILVDNSPGLRAFEEASGLQAVVKILKRAGTPREVRMKCLEFLYFYLLEESPTSTTTLPASDAPVLNVSAPSSPTKTKPPPTRTKSSKPALVSSPRKPASVYGSSTYSFPSNLSKITFPSTCSSSSSGSSSSGSSSRSTSSSSGGWGMDTDITSPPSSPVKTSQFRPVAGLPKSPTKASRERHVTPARGKSLLILKKEVEFTPLTPVKRKEKDVVGAVGQLQASPSIRSKSAEKKAEKNGVRSIEEKKEILGTMLGNVDALVEGVRKAGIWGLKGS